MTLEYYRIYKWSSSSMLLRHPSSRSCDHLETYANWDGLHLTETAYPMIYKSRFHGTYATPQFNILCPMWNGHTLYASSSSV
ncbi:putative sinapine esterase [Helianthus anomalus]